MCVCERSSGVLVVVRQISGGDDVSMDGGCGREGYGGGGREGEEMKGGVCQLDVRWRGQGMNELPPSLLPLCRFTCHLHGAVTERVCDLGGGCTPCTACDLHTSDAHSHFFSPPPRCLTLHVQARQCSRDAVWL